MFLNTLPKVIKKRKKRVGRGIGSGCGKTCGRGVKGQKSRSGVSLKGFEGGQQPIYRRLPKRGFVSLNRIQYVPLNIGKIKKFADSGVLKEGDVVDVDFLVSNGFVKKKSSKIKILSGDSENALNIKLKFRVAACSSSAKEFLEKGGSKIELI